MATQDNDEATVQTQAWGVGYQLLRLPETVDGKPQYRLESNGAMSLGAAEYDLAQLANRDDDAKMLSLMTLARLPDRLRAMEIRRDNGPADALEFLGKCTLTDESLAHAEDTTELGYDPDAAELVRIIDGLTDRILWASGVAYSLIMRGGDFDGPDIGAFSNIHEQLIEAQKLVDALNELNREAHGTAPPD